MLHLLRRHLQPILAAVWMLAIASSASAQIDVYFTRPVDSSLAMTPDNVARYSPDVSVIVGEEIRRATRSIDIAMYNLNVQRMVDALIAAHRRGVRIRVIANVDAVSNPASRFAQLAAAGIPLAANPRAASGSIQPLMHNKFIIIDGRPGSADSVPTVITGSWNATVAQTLEDANNVVIIRDSAVAGAYRAEFEEMWGSRGDTPNTSTARFGAAKSDNTGHSFTLSDGTRIALWFSPSDNVESHIRDALSTAQTSIYTANLTITSNVLANRVNQQKNIGADARVLIENIDDQGGQFGFLSGLVDARSTAGVPGQLHHKYAVVDAVPIPGGSLPLVVTGSHNWTYSANTINDENTIVIYNARIANQFLQEFAARYREAGGTRAFGVTSSAQIPTPHDTRVYPIPFSSSLMLAQAAVRDTDVTLIDALGRTVARSNLARGERRITFDDAPENDGVVLLVMTSCNGERLSLPVLRLTR